MSLSRLSLVVVAGLLLASCTFGVPIGEPSSLPAGGSLPKSKYGNPESYVVMGRRYFVLDSSQGFTERGVASWYGSKFHGRPTSSGEIYNMHAMTAAHKTLPIPVYVKVKNLDNGKSVVVRVNDRGPFIDDRIIDLSFAAATKIDMVGPGTANVEISAIDGPDNTQRPPVRVIPLQVNDEPAGDIFIQLGSFSERDNADNLRQLLEQNGEKLVVISEVNTSSGVFYRVRVGPLLNVEEAESIQKRLKRNGFDTARVVVDDQ